MNRIYKQLYNEIQLIDDNASDNKSIMSTAISFATPDVGCRPCCSYSHNFAALNITDDSHTQKKLQIQLASLDQLPPDLIITVIKFLEFRDRLNLSRTTKYLHWVITLYILREIYVVDTGSRVLNRDVTYCYHPEKLREHYLKYVECIHILDTSCDSTVFERFNYTLVRGRNHDTLIKSYYDYLAKNIDFLELRNAVIPANIEKIRVLKLHSDVQDIGHCFSDNKRILQTGIEELIIVGDPMIMSQFPKMSHLKALNISVGVPKFDYGKFWECLRAVVPLESLQKFEITFESSFCLGANPYIMMEESLRYLADINAFLKKLAGSLESVREVGVIVEDKRHCNNNIFKKAQPDVNQFLTLLPPTLDCVVIKLSNEFEMDQFKQFFQQHSQATQFTFFGNLSSRFYDAELYNYKVNMLNGGCQIKDFSMYGKFQHSKFGEKDLIWTQLFKDLSERSKLDYMHKSEVVVKDIENINLLRDMLIRKLDVSLQEGWFCDALTKINVNGIIFSIDRAKRTVECISD